MYVDTKRVSKPLLNNLQVDIGSFTPELRLPLDTD